MSRTTTESIVGEAVSETIELDARDKLLLSLLQKDGGRSLSELGKELGLTKMAVSNRIKRLKRAGVLGESHYVVNPRKVGEDYLLVTQVSCDVSGAEQEKVAAKIARLSGVQSVYLNFGPYDILLIARRKDRQSAKNLLYEITHLAGIRNTLTIIPHTVIKESLEVCLEDGPTSVRD